MIFDDYYDSVEYSKKLDELDSTGNPKYLPSKTVNVRQVAGGTEYILDKESTDTHYTKEYQVPFDIYEGDILDGHRVVDVEPSKDIFGELEFYIVRVL